MLGGCPPDASMPEPMSPSTPRPTIPLAEARVRLGRSDLSVSPVCLGTMTFGEQVDEATAFDLLDHAVDRGINFIDTAEMYAVPARRETYGATETILGRWFSARPGVRRRIVLATKVAGPSRNMDWVRQGAADLEPDHIRAACDASLARMQTDVIDLYQIHWPNRNAPIFGGLYFDPAKDRPQTSIHAQLEALTALVKAGKVRTIGLSNETPWGVGEFVRLAEQHGLARIVSVQNPYALTSRALDNGLDETMHRLDVSLLAYSPLGFGALTGKYDASGIDPEREDGPRPGTDAAAGRLARFESMRKQRWSRPEAIAAAREYNALARRHGLTPTRLALAFCYGSWRVASTIIGVTRRDQLDDDLEAWGTVLSPELLDEIDAIRWRLRDPAQ
jgi:aryl-alcohol dehydrogenase-like predicted oxidoreductase